MLNGDEANVLMILSIRRIEEFRNAGNHGHEGVGLPEVSWRPDSACLCARDLPRFSSPERASFLPVCTGPKPCGSRCSRRRQKLPIPLIIRLRR